MRALIVVSLVALTSPALADFVLPDGELSRIYGPSEKVQAADAQSCLTENGIKFGTDEQGGEMMIYTINVELKNSDLANRCIWPEGSGLLENR
ncbi:hypothetical protein HYT05_00605 [Candidatus Kaiserbacteria bacterium]|nr:hypothetical protein [Candidatus Kaiserbacteria bacterium]